MHPSVEKGRPALGVMTIAFIPKPEGVHASHTIIAEL